jgi:protein-tyrosine phosphatase
LLIDLHNHILPGVDDGAKDLAESLAMARVARNDGITTIVATPHRNSWCYAADLADAQRRLAEVQHACREDGCDVELKLGGEAYIAPDLANQVQTGLALTLNGSRYLLVEWPFDQYPLYSDQVIFELRVRGIVPIMAHAERYRVVQRDVYHLVPLIEHGVVVQVTTGSLLGDLGPEIQKVAETLLTEDLAHVLATDSHSLQRRPPVLSPGRERASQLIGAGRARAMVEDLPRQIVDNCAITLPPPKERRPKPFWAFWRSGT